MNKREAVLNVVSGAPAPGYVPAAFFMHFDQAHHLGQAAIDKHLEFFRYTGMDFVKIQYELSNPPAPALTTPDDWARVPHCSEEFFAPMLQVVRGLVEAAKSEALVILTVYSPFMWAKHYVGEADLTAHLQENPDAVKKGLEILTDNVLTLLRGCKRAGIDGFYTSTQGGETFRFGGTDIFQKYIKPTDLAVWDEIESCTFNILHVCDYEGGYDDLTPFLEYPGHVVNCSLKVGSRTLTPTDISRLFGRPFMGGMERKGALASGSIADVRQAAQEAMRLAPERFILGADCTVPNASWDNLKAAIDVAHRQ
jgi:uroporphyrinogen decarboxylase